MKHHKAAAGNFLPLLLLLELVSPGESAPLQGAKVGIAVFVLPWVNIAKLHLLG